MRVVGKEGKRACTQPSPAGQPCWNGKGPQRREEPLVGTSKLLFSIVEEGQTVILIFQATSSAKLAFPSSCWDGKLHRPVLPSPPLPRLCANKKLAFVLLTRQSWQKTDPSEGEMFLPPVPAPGLGLKEKLRGGLERMLQGPRGPAGGLQAASGSPEQANGAESLRTAPPCTRGWKRIT